MPPTSRFSQAVRIGAEIIGAGVISSAAVGSLILGGNLITDSGQNTAPSLVYDSGSYLTYQETSFVGSGTYALRAEIGIPSTYGSGALISQWSAQCRTITEQGFDAVVSNSPSAAGTGSNFNDYRDNFPVAADIPTGSNTGFLIMPIGSHFGLYAGSGGSMPHDCKLKLWTSEVY